MPNKVNLLAEWISELAAQRFSKGTYSLPSDPTYSDCGRKIRSTVSCSRQCATQPHRFGESTATS